MSVVLTPGSALPLVHNQKKMHRQLREQQDMEKAAKKHRSYLERPAVKAEMAKLSQSKEKEKDVSELVLSDRIPLDEFIARRGKLPHPAKTNPFANVNGSAAKTLLEKMGFKLEASGTSHFAVRSKPEADHPHGHRLGTLPVHPGETIPSGTHHAVLAEMNENLIGFLNQADDTAASLPNKKRTSFREFVAEKLAELGAKSASDILPEDLLSTKDHNVVKSIQALLKNANPDTVLKVWKDRPV